MTTHLITNQFDGAAMKNFGDESPSKCFAGGLLSQDISACSLYLCVYLVALLFGHKMDTHHWWLSTWLNVREIKRLNYHLINSAVPLNITLGPKSINQWTWRMQQHEVRAISDKILIIINGLVTNHMRPSNYFNNKIICVRLMMKLKAEQTKEMHTTIS
jgi:hypothetical protein